MLRLRSDRGSSAGPCHVEVCTIPNLVMTSLLHRLAAWLCLALAILTGVTPASGVVVCIKDDGCVRIEFRATDKSCGGCDGHEESNGHEESDSPVRSRYAWSDEVSCPCVDLPLPGLPDHQLAQSCSAKVLAGPAIFFVPEIRVDLAAPTVPVYRAPPPFVPRVPDYWAHIRSVVLLV